MNKIMISNGDISLITSTTGYRSGDILTNINDGDLNIIYAVVLSVEETVMSGIFRVDLEQKSCSLSIG